MMNCFPRWGRVLLLLLALPVLTQAQNVGIGTTTPDASAVLDLKSTSQGLLPPRLTSAQRTAIANPAAGLLVFQSDGTLGMYYYTGTSWVNLTSGRVPDVNGFANAPNNGVVTTLAGTAGSSGTADGTGSAASFYFTYGVAADAAGTLYVTDGNNTIRKITAAGVVTTLAGAPGQYGTADGQGAAARFNSPRGIAVDAAGTLYVADNSNQTIRKITAAGLVSTLAGTPGTQGSADGPGASASFKYPNDVAVDGAGNVYVTDKSNYTIRKITAAGVVSTLAGMVGSRGTADGQGAAALFNTPAGIAIDGAGTLYVTDTGAHTIRKVTSAGLVSTLAGLAGTSGSADGTGQAARFNFPVGIAVATDGTLYVADQSNKTIRKVTAAGVVTTLAGLAGSTGSADGTGAAARFNFPYGVAIDGPGTVYVTDQSNYTVRAIK